MVQYVKVFHADLDTLMDLIHSWGNSGWRLHSLHIAALTDGENWDHVAILERDRISGSTTA